jgi:hypothetical protein
MLHGIDWWLVVDVSGQPMGSELMGRAVKEEGVFLA